MITKLEKNAPVQVVDLITTDQDKKYEPAGRLATAIVEIVQEQGDCLPQDLFEKGFSPREVFQHWHMALSLANVEINLMNEKETDFKLIIRRK